jgi:ATP adenylyltransferase
MTSSPPNCPFCNADDSRVFLRQELVFALWDGFPVSEGHALIVPNRHVATWFDASHEEHAAIFGAIETVSEIIRAKWPVDGFNVGINIGAAAGQTVPHLHLHVIPRRNGDARSTRWGAARDPQQGQLPGEPPARADSTCRCRAATDGRSADDW